MILDVLNRTPGLLFTLLLISFVIGMMTVSIIDAKKANEKVASQLPVKNVS